jgi:hypothetical protein
MGKLTLSTIKHDENIIMLSGILNLIQANEPPLCARPTRQSALGLLDLALAPAFIDRKSELGVNKLEPKLAALVGLLECVGEAELEVHGVGVGEVFEKGKELDNVVLLDDLQADSCGGPLFVDGNDHAAAGDGEGVCEAGILLVTTREVIGTDVPVEFDVEASDG